MDYYIIYLLLVLVLIYFIYILFLKNNMSTAVYWCTSTCMKNDIPINEPDLLEVKQIIQKLNLSDNMEDYTFIDFGCGTGHALLYMHNMFNNSIGIEIDKKTSEYAITNTKNILDIEIINKDMAEYTFSNDDTVLFIYEPLFSVYPESDAIDIYSKVFDNINKVFSNSNKKIYIVYITGVFRQDIKKEFINEKNFKILSKKNTGALLLNRTIYLISKI